MSEDAEVLAAKAEALRDAAFDWTQGQWSQANATRIATRIVVQADSVGRWLLDRADRIAAGHEETP